MGSVGHQVGSIGHQVGSMGHQVGSMGHQVGSVGRSSCLILNVQSTTVISGRNTGHRIASKGPNHSYDTCHLIFEEDLEKMKLNERKGAN